MQTRHPANFGARPKRGRTPGPVFEVAEGTGGLKFRALPLVAEELSAFQESHFGGICVNVGVDPAEDALFEVDWRTGGVRMKLPD